MNPADLEAQLSDPAAADQLSPAEARRLLAPVAAFLERLRVRALAPAPPPPAADAAAEPRWLTVPEVAARLGVARSYVYELARRGALPVVRVGRYVRIPGPDLAAWERRLRLDGAGYMMFHARHDRRRPAPPPPAPRLDAGAARPAPRRAPPHGDALGARPHAHPGGDG